MSDNYREAKKGRDRELKERNGIDSLERTTSRDPVSLTSDLQAYWINVMLATYLRDRYQSLLEQAADNGRRNRNLIAMTIHGSHTTRLLGCHQTVIIANTMCPLMRFRRRN